MKWAVLVGGTGTNLQAILERTTVDVALVVSHRSRVGALEIAASHGVSAEVLPGKRYPDRAEYDLRLREVLADYGVEAIALAGFLRWLHVDTVRAFPGRILNLHPSLLPAFPGLGAIEQAMEWPVRITGVTVHFVDEGHDTGPIIWQEPVRITSDDTLATLTERIHRVEHRVYPQVVQWVDQGMVRLEPGRRVAWQQEPDRPIDDEGRPR